MKDISKKSAQDLRDDVAKATAKTRETRFGAAGAKTQNTKVLKNLRRSVAQMKTAIRAKELAETKKNA